MNSWRFAAQRLSALILAPLVLGHIAVIIYAVQNGLTGAEILARTRGSLLLGGYYGLFVIAACIHAGIGIETILREWGRAPATKAAWLAGGFTIIVLALGLRAVQAVV